MYFIPVAVFLIGGAFVVGMLRNRKFDRIENLHKSLARQLGLSISYLNQKDFTLFGKYRGYKVRIEGIKLPSEDRTETLPAIKCSVQMVNPQLKCLRVEKKAESFSYFNKLAFIPRPFNMNHNIGDWLSITTNDMMFASILLSDDLKISLFETFNPVENAILYIEGEEMVFLGLDLMEEQDRVNYYAGVLDLLADIKDDLNN